MTALDSLEPLEPDIDPSLAALADAILIPPFLGTTPPPWLLRALDRGLAGVTFFGSNMTGDTAALTATLRARPTRDGRAGHRHRRGGRRRHPGDVRVRFALPGQRRARRGGRRGAHQVRLRRDRRRPGAARHQHQPRAVRRRARHRTGAWWSAPGRSAPTPPSSRGTSPLRWPACSRPASPPAPSTSPGTAARRATATMSSPPWPGRWQDLRARDLPPFVAAIAGRVARHHARAPAGARADRRAARDAVARRHHRPAARRARLRRRGHLRRAGDEGRQRRLRHPRGRGARRDRRRRPALPRAGHRRGDVPRGAVRARRRGGVGQARRASGSRRPPPGWPALRARLAARPRRVGHPRPTARSARATASGWSPRGARCAAPVRSPAPLADPLVVEVEPEENIAAGRFPWGFEPWADVLRVDVAAGDGPAAGWHGGGGAADHSRRPRAGPWCSRCGTPAACCR